MSMSKIELTIDDGGGNTGALYTVTVTSEFITIHDGGDSVVIERSLWPDVVNAANMAQQEGAR